MSFGKPGFMNQAEQKQPRLKWNEKSTCHIRKSKISGYGIQLNGLFLHLFC